MPVVEIPEDRKYEKAVGLLLRMGGMFRTRPTHVLVVGDGQYRALVKAGLVGPNGRKISSRGQTHTKKKV